MPLQTGVCEPWPLDLDCTNCRDLLDQSPDDSPGGMPALLERWAKVASQILWAFSGRRIGLCDVSVRPCRQSCLDRLGITSRYGFAGFGMPFLPYTRNGKWYNATCGCTSDCSCGELCEVYLPGPVHSIIEVTIDGIVVDPDTYRVDAPGRLVRQQSGFVTGSPGESPGHETDDGCWPDCQDMAAPAGDPGTFVVAYRWGIEPDEAAIAAVSELTCELVRACPEMASKDCPCRLPGNVRRVVRQGVTIEMSDSTTIFAEGRTNLPLVDMWLASVNPNKLVAPPRVLSPDFNRPRVTTWP